MSSWGDPEQRSPAWVDFPNLPLIFEANLGQTDPRVRFLARGGGYTLFLTGTEAVLALREPRNSESVTALRLHLIGANLAPEISGVDQLSGKSNYFIGNDPARWRTNVPTYARVKYQNVYPGVDLVYYGKHRQLEYDFVVAPGADPTVIQLDIRGAGLRAPPLNRPHGKRASLRINARGELVIRTAGGEVRFHKPLVYQMAGPTSDSHRPDAPTKTFIDGDYVLASDHSVRFAVATYDRSKPLVIDPVLSYSTYLGGSGFDSGNAIAVDAAGSVYVTGETASTDFPTTMGAYQASNLGASDIFVAKLDPSGTSLVYSTYIGGTLSERGTSIAVDAAGNACVTGRTNSGDFPTVNAWQSQLFGDFDAFVAQVSAQGDALLFSTYLGGAGNDEGSGIAVDTSGNIYVTGGVSAASGDNFPTTGGAFQRLFGGGSNDAFVTKFDPTQSGSAILVYSTFLGGSDMDRGNGIAVDSSGNAYVTGRTRSTDFPTGNALQDTYGGGSFDVFVTKLNSMGTDILYSTYLGGAATDQGYGIAVDGSGNAYITGETSSIDFRTVNAYQSANGGGSSDAFLAEIDSTGTVLVYSTYVGGGGTDVGSGIAVDTSGIAYITGRTSSPADFPTTPDALQPTFGGGPSDAFVTKIDPSQGGTASLIYSSYLGGSGDEDIPAVGPSGNPSGGIAVDSSGNIYVTGNTSSTDFPSANPYQSTYGGDPSDAFVTKIGSSGSPDFAVTGEPSSATIMPGDAAVYTVTVTPSTGFTGSVDLNLSGLPTSSSAAFDPPTVVIVDASPGSSTLTVSTDTSTPVGTFPLTVTGAAGTLQHTAAVSLVISNSTNTDLRNIRSGNARSPSSVRDGPR